MSVAVPPPAPSILLGGVVMYIGVWMLLQPEQAWRCAHDFSTGLKRFEGSLRGQPWWGAAEGPSGAPALAGMRVAGAVVALLGVVAFIAGLSRIL